MNAPSPESFDDPNTLVMPQRPGRGAPWASGVMPVHQASGSIPAGQPSSGPTPATYPNDSPSWMPSPHPTSGVMPVGYAYGPGDLPAADVLSSYPPASAEHTPPSNPPLPLMATSGESEGRYAFQASPSDGRSRIAFVIVIGFLAGIGGTYGYEVATHPPEVAPAQVLKAAEPKPAGQASPTAIAKPADLKLAADPKPMAVAKPGDLKTATDTKPGAKAAVEPKAAPVGHRPTPSRPKRAKSAASPTEPNLDGRDLLSEGLD